MNMVKRYQRNGELLSEIRMALAAPAARADGNTIHTCIIADSTCFEAATSAL